MCLFGISYYYYSVNEAGYRRKCYKMCAVTCDMYFIRKQSPILINHNEPFDCLFVYIRA